jgi:hypothetical protein
MDLDVDRESQSGEDFKRAIPEPRMTKQMIFQSRQRAKRKLEEYRLNRDLRTFREYVNSLMSFYHDVSIYIDNLKRTGHDYTHLKNSLEFPQLSDELDDETCERYIQNFTELNELINKLGITDIGLQVDSQNFGQDLVNQFGVDVPYKSSDFSLDVENADLGWIRLQLEFQNVRKALRQDKDVVGGIFHKGDGGSSNRLGKTTLALQLCRIVENGSNTGKIPKRAICLNGEDFWTAQNKRPKYSTILLDELSGIFYSGDAMKDDQKKRKKRMKTGAKKNQFQVGTDTNFYKVDKEFRTDKFDFVVLVPERGKGELYGPTQIQKFEQGDDGQIDTGSLPDPLFKFKFPKIPEDENLWQIYEEREEEKVTEVEKEQEGKGVTISQYVKMVKDRKEYFKKEVNGRTIIDKNLVQAEWEELGEPRAKQVKAKVEADLGIA